MQQESLHRETKEIRGVLVRRIYSVVLRREDHIMALYAKLKQACRSLSGCSLHGYSWRGCCARAGGEGKALLALRRRDFWEESLGECHVVQPQTVELLIYPYQPHP
jgi:hypothetical protein